MKRILILGAGNAQLNLIKEAKNLGYYVIVCDKRPEMEGSKLADKFYEVDYMERDTVYEIANKENIDGITSNSEPAMVNVAWIANALNLPGNSVQSIEILTSKSRFRDLQKRAGIFSPEHYTVETCDELLEIAREIKYPVIIKPVESCGTQGTTKIDKFDEEYIKNCFNICRGFSRNNLVEIERYIPMNSLRVIECDIFVCQNQILWDGMISTYRSSDAPMVPMTYVYPSDISDCERQTVISCLKHIVKESGITLGEFNVEGYFNEEELFIIEINPRQGGNRIPEMIKEYSGVDLTKLLVSTATGEYEYFHSLKNFRRTCKNIVLHVVYSQKSGVFKGLFVSEDIKRFVTSIDMLVNYEDEVKVVQSVFDALAVCVLEFNDREEQLYFIQRIENEIVPQVQ